MENNKIIIEEIQGGDIAQTDTNLTVEAMFQQTALPSLARQICSIVPISGPSGALFNIRKQVPTDPNYNALKPSFRLLRRDATIEASNPIHSGITKEAIQDMMAMYGKEAEQVIGKLLRGLANDQENDSLKTFLDSNSLLHTPGLTLTNSLNAETNLFEISQKVHELVLQSNSSGLRTYEAFAILPYHAAASVMALTKYVGGEDKDSRGLFIGQVGQTKFYMSPWAETYNAGVVVSGEVYVGLKDSENMSKSSAIFSPYQSSVVEAQDPNSGESTYHIYNRYAITASPLHETSREMLHKFILTY